jgi:hypothetical protein
MECEFGPDPFVVSLSIVCVPGFVLYLSLEFLKKVLWKVIVPSNGLYCFLLDGKECISVIWNLNAAIFCSMG